MLKNKLRKDHPLPIGTPTAALLLGLIFTAMATYYIHTDVAAEERRRFHELSSQIQEQIQLRLQRYEDSLMHTRSFFAASREVSRGEFHEFFSNSNLFARSPGFRGVGYALKVPGKNLEEHIRKVRKQGFPEYSIWPEFPRPEYFATLYYEPFDWKNQKSFGFDMGTEPVRRAAMDQARDSGNATLSGRVALLRGDDENGEQTGFLIYMPLYRNHMVPLTVEERREKLLGFLYSPFRSQDLFGRIFNEDSSAYKLVQFEIYDGNDPSPQTLLYDSDEKIDFGGGSSPKWKETFPVTVNDHTWTIYVSSLPPFTSRTSRYATLFVALAGLIFSVLGFWILHALKRRMEEERRRLNEETLARIEMEKLAADRKQAVAARDDFLSICSHELRTPLTSLKLQTQLNRRLMDREGAPPPTPEKFRGFLDNTNVQIDRLVRLVEDMLDISRIRAGKLSLRAETVNLRELVEEVTERFAPQLSLSGVRISLSLADGVEGHWDRFRIEQVLVNLLTNAMKYGGGTPIEIQLSCDGGVARLEVADAGAGIAPESQGRIFERFERAVSQHNISGLGLGLFIVRQIVEAHGGTISVVSEVGQGARFVVNLPLDSGLPSGLAPVSEGIQSEMTPGL